jgi:hypothetical protein
VENDDISIFSRKTMRSSYKKSAKSPYSKTNHLVERKAKKRKTITSGIGNGSPLFRKKKVGNNS